MSLAVSPAPKVTMASVGHRVPAIDVLRGLCIIAVVLHHINLRIVFKNSAFGAMLSPAVNRVLFWNGAYGVSVFFVISGFLITTWSLKRWGAPAQINLRQFYRMRFARIMPCLLALLGLLSILHLTGRYGFVINPQRTTLPRALLAALTFHVNWLESARGYLPAAWDVLWSLSVEEMFYVFFPVLCRTTRNLAAFITVLSCFVIIGPFARTILTHNSLWQDYGYLACMDGIALGCIAAVVVRVITVHAINARKIILQSRVLLGLQLIGAALVILITAFRHTTWVLGLPKAGLNVTVLEFGAAIMLIAMQLRFESGTTHTYPINAVFRWFGRNSYEVYLTHMLVVWPMMRIFYDLHQPINAAPLWFLAITALAGVLGYVVARFYSEPLNRRLRAKIQDVQLRFLG
jgi:peptidoglycan/LPS O-acetylase OafA/YrhL